MKILITFLLLLSTASRVHAQSDEDKKGVEAAIMDYIEGFYEGDTLKITRSISANAVKYGYWKSDKTMKYEGEPMSFQEMINYAAGVKKRNKPAPVTAPKKVDVYEVQDQTASGKVTAWWGTDYVLLEKTGNKWMIRMVLWQGPLKK